MLDARLSAKLPDRILDPMDRISEILFGLIIALTFTLTFAVATADNMAVRTMLFAALGCNLAWGIIDGGVYLLARLNQQGRALLRWRAVRDAPHADTAQRLIADALPTVIATTIEPAQLETMRQKVHQLREP